MVLIIKAYLWHMKKMLQRISLVSAAILYFLSISHYGGSNIDAFLTPHASQEKASHVSEASSNLICHAIKTENLVNALNGFPKTSLKRNLNRFSDCFTTNEQSFFKTFSQYTFYSRNVIFRFHQTDIIFPFHYFW